MAIDLEEIKNNYHDNFGKHQKYLHDYYMDKEDVVPIYQRSAQTETVKDKYHTNLHVDFPGMIIDFKIGYMGKDIEFDLQKEPYSDTEYNNIIRELREFEFDNNLESLDAESMKLSSVSGISHRLLYIKNGKLRARNIEGWKVVYEYEDDIYDPERAYWFYMTEDGEERCDIFDDDNIYHMIRVETKRGGKVYVEWKPRQVQYLDEDGELVESYIEPHLLGQVPIFPIMNNKDWMGDFSKATDTMDRYDEVISDEVGEIKSIRGNYMVIYGIVDEEDPDYERKSYLLKENLKKSNLIGVPTDSEGNKQGDVEILDVNIPDDAIQNTLRNLRQHIFEESKSIDIKKISETSDARVFTIKTMLMPVENNAKTTESYFKMALRKQYRILAFFLSNSGKPSFDYRDLDFTFNRSFPTDDQARAQTLAMLFNYMAPEDAYRIAGYENPDQLAEKWKENNMEVSYRPDENDVIGE